MYLQYSTRQEIVNSTRSVEQGGNVLLVSLENLGVRSQALTCSLASSPSLQNGTPLLCSTSAPSVGLFRICARHEHGHGGCPLPQMHVPHGSCVALFCSVQAFTFSLQPLICHQTGSIARCIKQSAKQVCLLRSRM